MASHSAQELSQDISRSSLPRRILILNINTIAIALDYITTDALSLPSLSSSLPPPFPRGEDVFQQPPPSPAWPCSRPALAAPGLQPLREDDRKRAETPTSRNLYSDPDSQYWVVFGLPGELPPGFTDLPGWDEIAVRHAVRIAISLTFAVPSVSSPSTTWNRRPEGQTQRCDSTFLSSWLGHWYKAFPEIDVRSFSLVSRIIYTDLRLPTTFASAVITP
ncbi:hypothetical protein F4821DRAFT_261884 [Hypoxylon rubiginosum]|uniref:Uncharacterized protein n=1 Tax=Hypoxylon rubiginosum TaxID=110542 RepID=A0ACC0CVP1_9PEZI|nr:hypothetical protein F4821DRAFT_261884 [Hypoxylon rubiginosum]